MSYVKVVKNKAYFKRFQTKFRRRREGKTDYRARKRLVAQAKNKYNMPKYRLVVRFTNRKVIMQIIRATLKGDEVLFTALSTELRRYGLKVGYKNACAAYCTGLLLARRVNSKMQIDRDGRTLADAYAGNKLDGKVYKCKPVGSRKVLYVHDLDWESEKRPFRCNLDVGIKTVTTGSKIFAAVKGAADGGLDVPHSFKRFHGYDPKTKKFKPSDFRDRILGADLEDYMGALQDEDEDQFAKRFAKYEEAGMLADDMENGFEGFFKDIHAAIRADPFKPAGDAPAAQADGRAGKGNGDFVPGPPPAAEIAKWKANNKYKQRLTQAQRAERVAAKKAAYSARLGAISQGNPMEEDQL
jgi:large subunit ribosomal protein L5e